MTREKLEQAKKLILEKQYEEARALLRSMPDDPTAQNWLTKLNERAPERLPVPKKSRRPIIAGFLVISVVGLLVLLWVFVFSGNHKKPEDYTADELQRALLTLDDMPSGWAVVPQGEDSQDNEESGNSFLCGEELEIDANTLTSAEIQFKGGELAPILYHGVAVYPEGEAKRLFTEFTGILESCQDWQDEDEYTWHAAEMSFPEFGSDSAAYRISTSDVPFIGVLEAQIILIRDGNFLILVMHADIGLDGVDTEQTEKFTRQANDKLQNIK